MKPKSYFRSKVAAIRYYELFGYRRANILHGIAEGAIHIGQPPLRPGETLRHMEGGRYAVRRA